MMMTMMIMTTRTIMMMMMMMKRSRRLMILLSHCKIHCYESLKQVSILMYLPLGLLVQMGQPLLYYPKQKSFKGHYFTDISGQQMK